MTGFPTAGEIDGTFVGCGGHCRLVVCVSERKIFLFYCPNTNNSHGVVGRFGFSFSSRTIALVFGFGVKRVVTVLDTAVCDRH